MENIDELVGVISYVNIGGSGEQGPPGPPGKDGKGLYFADKDTPWQDIVDAAQRGEVVFYNKGPKNFPTYYQLLTYTGGTLEFYNVVINRGIVNFKSFVKVEQGDGPVYEHIIPYADVPEEAGTYVLRATKASASDVPIYEWVPEV